MGPLRTGNPASIDAEGVALGLLELQSIARGFTVADAAVKRAAVKLRVNRPVSPGKHLIVFDGDVAEVEESMEAARKQAGTTLCDDLLLAQVHEEVLWALSRKERRPVFSEASCGILETLSAASTVRGADAACKAAEVQIFDLRLCDGLGGKGFCVFFGTQDMVQAALATIEHLLSPGLLFGLALIARPDVDFLSSL